MLWEQFMYFQLSEIKIIGLTRHRQMLLSRMKMRILQNLPEKFKKVLFYGKNCYCPVCESYIHRYEAFGHLTRSWCPVCSSMRWQRFGWLFLKKRTNLFDGIPKKMLHIAPEVSFEPRLKQVTNLDYLTGDLFDPNVMVKMDVTDIPFPNNSFDTIFCSHVMEHIPNDRKALKEFFRVLNCDGWAVFIVPIRLDRLTDEDLTVTDPKEREKRFGQYDHVRFYGRDFEERLQEAGFKVTLVKASDLLEIDRLEFLGLREKEVLFYCQK
jgi:SAM-dependent methyltransferase